MCHAKKQSQEILKGDCTAMRKDIFDLKQFGDQAWDLALQVNEIDRAVSFWQDKKNVADYHIAQNNKKLSKLREKISEIVKDRDGYSDHGCEMCGLSCSEYVDMCDWCYKVSNGGKI